jgi:hypothetical protein
MLKLSQKPVFLRCAVSVVMDGVRALLQLDFDVPDPPRVF